MIDPYQVLGVSKTASQDEIKSAYKKLARKFHPDLNQGNKDAEKKFKEVAHAFDLIGTADARKKFDLGEMEDEPRERPFYYQSQGNQGRYSSNFDFDDDIFEHIFGRSRPKEKEQYELEVDFLEAARGAERVITLPDGKKLQVKIPAGIQEGQKLRFPDFFITIKIKPSDEFRREGKDIYSEVPVSFFEAINGAEVTVKTIHGAVSLKVPSGVSTGSKLRIKGKGVGSEGNHIVTIKVVTPKNPSADLKESIRNLEKQFSYNPRIEL